MEKLFTSSNLESISKALSNHVSGSQIARILSNLKISDITPSESKWKRLNNALTNQQDHSNNRHATLEFIRQVIKPELYINRHEQFEDMRSEMNHVLVFCGLVVDERGYINEVTPVETLYDAERRMRELRNDLKNRNVHKDVLIFCHKQLVDDNYFHTVLEATKSIAHKLRARTGLSSDGSILVEEALSGLSPKLKINPLETKSHESEQKGFSNLIKGAFGMFRNVAAHEADVL